MATISTLCDEGALEKHQAELDVRDSVHRVVLMAMEFRQWYEGELFTIPTDRGVHVTPFEQVEQMLYEFIIGKRLTYASDHRKLDPLSQHVWELKTPDIRVFGWFPMRAHFIAVCGAPKSSLLTFDSYTPFIDRVVGFRDQLALDEPKFLTGVRADEVL